MRPPHSRQTIQATNCAPYPRHASCPAGCRWCQQLRATCGLSRRIGILRTYPLPHTDRCIVLIAYSSLHHSKKSRCSHNRLIAIAAVHHRAAFTNRCIAAVWISLPRVSAVPELPLFEVQATRPAAFRTTIHRSTSFLRYEHPCSFGQNPQIHGT